MNANDIHVTYRHSTSGEASRLLRHQVAIDRGASTRRTSSADYFFNAAAQLSTTAIGAAVASVTLEGRGMRKC